MRSRLRFAPILALALAVVAPTAAQAQVAYWCGPLHAPYPQVKTCPVPWLPYSTAPDPYYNYSHKSYG